MEVFESLSVLLEMFSTMQHNNTDEHNEIKMK